MKSSSDLADTVTVAGQAAADSILLMVSGSLALIILLLVSLAWLVRRCGLSRHIHAGQGAITLIASRSLGARERIVLVDIADRRLVLGVTAAHITCLATLENSASAVTASPADTAADFPSLLRRLCRQYSGKSR